MVRASVGFRRSGRRRLKREVRHKYTVEALIKAFKPNDRVIINIDPSSGKGMPSLKYAGFTGTVVGSRGKAYIVSLKKGNKNKEIVVRPEHIKRL